MACPRCNQVHPGDEVCPRVLEERYGTLEDRSETLEQLTEDDDDDE